MVDIQHQASVKQSKVTTTLLLLPLPLPLLLLYDYPPINYKHHINNHNAKLPQLRQGPRKGAPRERKRSLLHLLHRLSLHHPRQLSHFVCHLQQRHTKGPHKRQQGLESAQEAPPRNELCLRRLLQPRLLTFRISQLKHRVEPQAQRRGAKEERAER